MKHTKAKKEGLRPEPATHWKSLFARHALAFFFAALLCFPVTFLLLSLESSIGSRGAQKPLMWDTMFTVNDTTTRMRAHLKAGGIFVLGSSELWTESSYRTCQYLYDRGVPCLALGHSGNQSLSMAIVMAAHADVLASANVMILSGPGWYDSTYSKGTSLSRFLEFADEPTLYAAWANAKTPAALRKRIEEFVIENYSYIKEPHAALRLIHATYKAQHDSGFGLELERIGLGLFLRAKHYLRPESNLFGLEKAPANLTALEPLPSTIFPEKQRLFEASSNNGYYVTNDYFNKYLRGKQLPLRIAFSPLPSQEFVDFQLLLSVVDATGAKPFFVMEPLNPRVYAGLSGFMPVKAAIQNELKRRDLAFFDMFVEDDTHYTPGLLMDSMHLGDIGWITVNNAFFNYIAQP